MYVVVVVVYSTLGPKSMAISNGDDLDLSSRLFALDSESCALTLILDQSFGVLRATSFHWRLVEIALWGQWSE